MINLYQKVKLAIVNKEKAKIKIITFLKEISSKFISYELIDNTIINWLNENQIEIINTPVIQDNLIEEVLSLTAHPPSNFDLIFTVICLFCDAYSVLLS